MPTHPDPAAEAGLNAIVAALLAAYDEDSHAGPQRPRLPAQQAIVEVLDQIRRLLFPGYYADERVPAASRGHRVGTWVCSLHTDLSRVLRMAFQHDDPALGVETARARAMAISARFLSALPAIRRALRLDAEAALRGDPAARTVEEVILTYPGFEAISVYRVAHWLHGAGVPYLARAMSEHAHGQTGIDIHPGAQIGRRFFIDHGTGVVVGESTEIGDDVKIYQGVTLGALSVRRDLAGAKRHPTLEDRVVIYAGATVLGGQTVIGEGAVIGGNVWLTSSVGPGMTVMDSKPTLDIRQLTGTD